MSKQIQEMIGQKYNKLTVLKNHYDAKAKRNLCVCQCECGNIGNFKPTLLKNGRSKSCGCASANKFIDMTGWIFERLTVISLTNIKNTKGIHKWLCQCICGEEIIVNGEDLRRGNTKSCGCYAIEKRRNAQFKHGHTMLKCETLTYKSWLSMNRRCYGDSVNEQHKRIYQDRGITVCQRWRYSFKNFLTDMGERPSRNHSIDRINNNGNYEPGNCRWATAKEQANNSRMNRILEFNNKKLNVEQWSEYTGINSRTLITRLSRGWSIERTLTTPPIKY